MTETSNELDKAREKVKELEEKLAEELREERTQRRLPLRKLAERAHELFCQYNHTDGCAWGYEEDKKDPNITWETFSHKYWLEKIEEAMKTYKITPEQLNHIFDVVEKLKEYPYWKQLIFHFRS
jgi:DNA-binding protein H-NS